jgi:hypothetical protein
VKMVHCDKQPKKSPSAITGRREVDIINLVRKNPHLLVESTVP